MPVGSAASGVITLDTLDGGRRTRVEWAETLVPPILPNLGSMIQGPILGRVFQADLERLKSLVETDRAGTELGAAATGPTAPIAPVRGRVERERARRQPDPGLTGGRDHARHRRLPTAAVRIHLVDATYELFRAFYAPRPAVLAADGRDLTATWGLVENLLAILRDEGATHLGCRDRPGHRVVPQRPVSRATRPGPAWTRG